jgi:predicted DNA binding protein
VLADGTVAQLGEFDGDADRFYELAGNADNTHSLAVTDRERGFYHVHFEPRPVTRDMMRARRRTSLALKMPLEMGDDGAIIGTFIGDDSAFGDALAEIPDEVEVDIERMGEVVPSPEDVFGMLTARQQEVLDHAVEEGYYEDPRQATHADLAEGLDCSPATVGEHLRRIEHRVFATYAEF